MVASRPADMSQYAERPPGRIGARMEGEGRALERVPTATRRGPRATADSPTVDVQDLESRTSSGISRVSGESKTSDK